MPEYLVLLPLIWLLFLVMAYLDTTPAERRAGHKAVSPETKAWNRGAAFVVFLFWAVNVLSFVITHGHLHFD